MNWQPIWLLVAFALIVVNVSAQTDLAYLQSFTMFTKGNINLSNGQTTGRIACGGQAILNNYDIGSDLSYNCKRTDFLSGGTLTYTNGAIERGALTARTTPAITDVYLACPQLPSRDFVDFDNVFAILTNTSIDISKRKAYGHVSLGNGNLLFQGRLHENFFTIAASELSTASSVNVTIPQGAYAFVTVVGQSPIIFQNMSIQTSDSQRVLWNFQTDSISISTSFEGSILAPYAALSLNQGSLKGSVASLSVASDSATFTFSPYLPPDSNCTCIDCPPVWYLPPYTQFVQTNILMSSSQNEGRTAAGGNGNFTSFSIGSKLPYHPNFPSNTTTIGGYLNFTSGNINGTSVVGGNCFITDAQTGPVICNTTIDIDFATSFKTLDFNTRYFSIQRSNGIVELQYGTLYLTSQDSGLNVFSLTSATFSQASVVSIQCPNTSWAIINIPDQVNALQNIQVSLTGISANRVIFNLFETTSLVIANVGVQGSILAPLADVTFSSGNVNGTLVAYSLTGSGFSQYNLALPLKPPCPPCICT